MKQHQKKLKPKKNPKKKKKHEKRGEKLGGGNARSILRTVLRKQNRMMAAREIKKALVTEFSVAGKKLIITQNLLKSDTNCYETLMSRI